MTFHLFVKRLFKCYVMQGGVGLYGSAFRRCTFNVNRVARGLRGVIFPQKNDTYIYISNTAACVCTHILFGSN